MWICIYANLKSRGLYPKVVLRASKSACMANSGVMKKSIMPFDIFTFHQITYMLVCMYNNRVIKSGTKKRL